VIPHLCSQEIQPLLDLAYALPDAIRWLWFWARSVW
jgi:hypothetical protein